MALTGAQDPTYLAYLRALGMQEDAARGLALRQTAAVQRQVQSAVPEIARLGNIQRARIGDSFEARGVYRSGMRQQRQSEQAAGEAYKVGSLQGQAADRSSLIQGNLGSTLAELATQRAEKAAQYGVGV